MPSAPFDRRLTPARADLAAEHLRGLVDAPRYAKGRAMRIVAASAPLRRSPQADAPLETEALYGESVDGLRRAAKAGPGCSSSATITSATCRSRRSARRPSRPIGSRRCAPTPIRARAIKLPPRMALSLGAQLTIVGREGDFAVSADGLHLWARHLAEFGAREPDFVAVAERFLETPYLWGGRTSEGIDCSGLVQTALDRRRHRRRRATATCRRRRSASPSPSTTRAPLARGDLVFWKGHVGIMRDAATLLHANGWHMKVGERAARRSARPHRRERRRRGDERAETRATRSIPVREAERPTWRATERVDPAPRGEGRQPYFLPPMPRPAKRVLKRDRRPPRSSELLRAAGPGRMGVRVDVEVQRRALLAVGRAGHELDAVGHDDLDHVVVGVDVGLHRRGLGQNKQRAVRRSGGSFGWRSYSAAARDASRTGVAAARSACVAGPP